MNTIKKRFLIFTCTTSLLISGISICQFSSSKTANKVKEHVQNCHDEEIDIIAHRGFSSLALDNSKESIDLCSNYNCVDGIEIDIHLTKDNIPVLSHNESITTEKGEKIILEETKWKDISSASLKNKKWKRNILSLKHFINPYNGYLSLERKNIRNEQTATLIHLEDVLKNWDEEKQLVLDIKYLENEEKFNEIISKIIMKYPNIDILLQSFSMEGLESLKHLLPLIERQYIIKDYEQFQDLDKISTKNLAIKHSLVTYPLLKKLIDQGYFISIWNVNQYETFDHITSISGKYQQQISYISNYPDCVCTWSHEKKKK